MLSNIFFSWSFLVMFLFQVSLPAAEAVVRDVDGNAYRTVSINGMAWMAENLSVRHYRNGDPIRHARSAAEWASAARSREGAWCYFQNRTANGSVFGKLYNYYAVHDSRGLAPAGWRIPTDRDWDTLADYYGGKVYAARHLKAKAQWQNLCPSEATNSSGFTALPGGYRRVDGVFLYAGQIGMFWSSSKFVEGYAWFRNMTCRNTVMFRNDTNMGNGLSVRCIR
ncbi:MAG: fibrobacter succinogenes major paralogous domain-containing protein [Prosthecochloris sp.]|uniref:fibrobacter succinogenes major paralogous domain-containing protein n=1 Tax=Prosthecochloris sp. TaxID=290513 RepID=UPI002583269F|nr:fibrobacter succinogenes major paralogous domain-containing protein [Prosthecochloris sp.]MCW8797352.1 fibrobacter succinogenes major paralogous domain-containing protein [Prosthecochloris sp.]